VRGNLKGKRTKRRGERGLAATGEKRGTGRELSKESVISSIKNTELRREERSQGKEPEKSEKKRTLGHASREKSGVLDHGRMSGVSLFNTSVGPGGNIPARRPSSSRY